MFQRILVAIDGSRTSDCALEEAIKLAKDQRACLRVVHVVDLGPLYEAEASGIDTSEAEEAVTREGWRELDRAKARAQQAGIIVETKLLAVYDSPISDAIIDDAKRWPADLIVLGTHGRHGLSRLVLGSVAEGVARRSPIPVLLVHGPNHPAGDRGIFPW